MLVKFTASEAFYEAFGVVVSVAFRVFVVFMGHWSWTLVAFYSISSVYGDLGLNVSCGVYYVFVLNGVLGMGACKVNSV